MRADVDTPCSVASDRALSPCSYRPMICVTTPGPNRSSSPAGLNEAGTGRSNNSGESRYVVRLRRSSGVRAAAELFENTSATPANRNPRSSAGFGVYGNVAGMPTMVGRSPLEQRREELVAAAIRVISRDGVAKATARLIVAESEMSLGAFGYPFATQDELMRSVSSCSWSWRCSPGVVPGTECASSGRPPSSLPPRCSHTRPSSRGRSGPHRWTSLPVCWSHCLMGSLWRAWLADRDSDAARRTAEFAASGLAAHARSISD